MSFSTPCKGIANDGLDAIKKRLGKFSVPEVYSIYKMYGATSEEYFESIKHLIYSLQHKYMGRSDEDCFNDCYIRILESFEYWDESKSNIVSWIHLVVRNKISSFNYTKKKLLKEDYQYEDSITKGAQDKRLPAKDILRTFIKAPVRVSISTNDMDSLVEILYLTPTHPLAKSAVWESKQEDFLCLKAK